MIVSTRLDGVTYYTPYYIHNLDNPDQFTIISTSSGYKVPMTYFVKDKWSRYEILIVYNLGGKKEFIMKNRDNRNDRWHIMNSNETSQFVKSINEVVAKYEKDMGI